MIWPKVPEMKNARMLAHVRHAICERYDVKCSG